MEYLHGIMQHVADTLVPCSCRMGILHAPVRQQVRVCTAQVIGRTNSGEQYLVPACAVPFLKLERNKKKRWAF